MLVREAVNIIKSAKLSETSKWLLLCSFEPLHLKTYLQAYLAQRFPAQAPEVLAFGYDQLSTGLDRSSSSLNRFPALLCLSWEDLHPALSWRGRGKKTLAVGDVAREAERLKQRLGAWIMARTAAETYVVLPPLSFLPLLDSGPTVALGPIAVSASAAMWDIGRILTEEGGRLVTVPPADLNFRDLLLAGCPLSTEHSELIVTRLLDAAYRAVPRKKALVVDLDGTLWHGVIGEEGPDGVLCRPEGKGYSFRVFQEFLLKLKTEGVLLAFCTKNNPGDVLSVFDAMGMPLKLADFASHRCNWDRKSDNLPAIARDLNIGLDALVFVDNDEAELAEVRRLMPEVVCFRTPAEGEAWRQLFDCLQDLFATWRVGHEDRIRTDTFAANRRRESAHAQNADTSDRFAHLSDMQLDLTLRRDAFSDPRSLELINKTNQFNLTGERISQPEWLEWAAGPGTFCVSARLKDRFGDFGTIAVITGRVTDDAAVTIRQFVVSCRAFGRGVETVLLAGLVERMDAAWIVGPFKDTGKNEPAKQFLASLGCESLADGSWRLQAAAARAASQSVLEQTRMTIRISEAGAQS